MKIHEDICVFYSRMPTYNPQGLIIGEYKTSRAKRRPDSIYNGANIQQEYTPTTRGNYPKTVQKFSNPSNHKSLHPTQKPVALIEYLIKTYTNEDDTVLDNCMGSGTTLVVCKNLNRKGIGIEIEDKYCAIAKKRIKREIRQLTII